MDHFVERYTPVIFIVIGLLMLVAAALADMADGVAVTFAVLGVGLIALGGLVRVLEGAFELGPQGLKGQIAKRSGEVVAVAEVVNPAAAESIREAVTYVDPYWESPDGRTAYQMWRDVLDRDPDALVGHSPAVRQPGEVHMTPPLRSLAQKLKGLQITYLPDEPDDASATEAPKE